MNILVLNGNPDRNNTEFDQYLSGYQLKLHKTGHYVKTFRLREMRINSLEGSKLQDASNRNLFAGDDTRYIINSLSDCDLLVWASPLTQGTLSLMTRMVQDHINRYFQDNLTDQSNHWHHGSAEHRIPLIGVIVQPENDTTPKQMLLIRLAQERMAADVKMVMSFMITTESGPAGAVCETFRSFDYRLFIESTCEDFLAHMAS